MGIRTKGFTKISQKSGEVGEDKVLPLPKVESTENKIDPSGSKEEEKKVPLESEPVSKAVTPTRVTNNIARSPLKLRTPSTMARLGGIKVAARKLKKHRKRSLLVHSASKILRSSIKSNKTRRACRIEEKTRVNVITPPSRISTRTCVRRSSREGIPEAPLRTVELIKRPLELREPATKLLYMASLGLYPKTGESDMTPIVVIKELNCSPGKKNGVRKSLELPLIPYHKRFLDLASHDKESISENIMPGGKQLKRDSRKTSPINKNEKSDIKKPVTGRKTPVNSTSPPAVTETQKIDQGLSSTESGKSNPQQPQHELKKKTLPPKTSNCSNAVNLLAKQASTLDLTITASPGISKMSSSFTHESGKLSPNTNSKSLLKSNISPPSKYTKDSAPLAMPLNLTTSFPSKNEAAKPITTESLLASACSVTQAMNLIMSNITILPTSNSATTRKRCANDISDLKIEEITNSRSFTIHNANNLAEKKPPKKKQKQQSNGEKNARFSLPTVVPMPISVGTVNAANCASLGGLFLQPMPTQNSDEALNLCMKKRNSEPLATPPVMQLPPKLQMNSNVNIQKINMNGSKPLNLIIPRPPPLMKAPLEAKNFANCPQNLQSVMLPKTKAHSKKAKKPRSNNNQLNQSSLQVQEPLPVLPPLPLIANTDTTVHAKSLLKCMNGEENACAREIGESLDSVKTMLSRLQTRIGPAVNGVRLITIE